MCLIPGRDDGRQFDWHGRADAHRATVDFEQDTVEGRRLRHQLEVVAGNDHLDAPAAELERSRDGEESRLAAVLCQQHVTAAGWRVRRVGGQDQWNSVERQHLVTLNLAHACVVNTHREQ